MVIQNRVIKKKRKIMERKELVKKRLRWERATVVQVGFVVVFLFAGMVFTPVNAQNTDIQEKDTTVYQVTDVEKLPEFQGGDEALYKFLRDNLKYPEQARALGMEGVVMVGFVVNKDGTISNVITPKNPHQSLSDEAIRVVKLMPKWKPGMQDGKAVNVRFILPIEFKLTGGSEKKTKK